MRNEFAPARAAAQAAGEMFFDGYPCPQCGETRRYVSSWQCEPCLTHPEFSNWKSARADARRSSERFYDGRPCPKGHGTRRYTTYGTCVECQAVKRAADADYMRDYAQKYRKKNPEKILLRSANTSAKKRGLDFDLTLDDIVIPDRCPMLGIPINREGIGNRSPDQPSLDRIDNSRGYVKGNVAVISWEANRLKQDLSLIQAEQLVAYMQQNLGSQPV